MTSHRQVAVVTGASSGIGAGLVAAYRRRGWNVVANARSIAPAQDDGVVAVAGDIGQRDTAHRLVATALERFGRLDTIVNNAGIFVAKPFALYDEHEFAAFVGTHLAAFFHLTQAALGVMAPAGRGHVVSITTSLVAQPDVHVPSALTSLTKGGVDAASRSLAIEFAARGIRVNVVAPGIVKTPMHALEAHPALAALHPMQRMGEVADIVDAVLYLESAPFVTGQVLHVDGGMHAGR